MTVCEAGNYAEPKGHIRKMCQLNLVEASFSVFSESPRWYAYQKEKKSHIFTAVSQRNNTGEKSFALLGNCLEIIVCQTDWSVPSSTT